MDDLTQGDICRVCRCEGQSDRPLFHPCICTGSIKWIHQECLTQWMRYSRKEYCELCGHRFSFTPIYSPDMPRVLPLRDVAGGLLSSVGTAVKYWLHYTLVALAWLGIVPLTAYRTYRFLFSGSLDTFLTLFNSWSKGNIAADVFRGCVVVTCTLFAFIGLVWLREQILHGGGPDWLLQEGNGAGNEQDANGGDGAENEAEAPVAPNVIPENNNNVNNAHNNNLNNINNDNHLNGDVVQPNAEEPPLAEAAPLYGFGINGGDHGGGNPQPPADVPMDNAEPPQAEPDQDEAPPDADQEAAGDEANWNPMEWERAAEDLTWERLLGLDGSMIFLEHVFWVISLNTIFIFVFAFCPYTIGSFAISLMGVADAKQPLMHFHGLLTTMLGYCIIALTLVNLHAIARFFRLRKPRRVLGLCYIVVKVSLLSVVEIGVLPLICGWWLDICSLPMFDSTLKDRTSNFKAAPGTSLFIHWMFGMVFVYYCASFIVLLREVLRPGVLWFLRNMNDPDFSPIQEMIHLSILRHIRRLIASAVIFGTIVLLAVWLPIQILKTVWPSFLPYTLSGNSEVNELSLQLLLLQIILPGFFEQSLTRVWLKALLRFWCNVVSWTLGIKSYLMGNDNEAAGNGNNGGAGAQEPRPEGGGLGAAHDAMLRRGEFHQYQPYDKPSFFYVRILGLFLFMCVSLVVGSLVTLTVPVYIGRHGMALWSAGLHMTSTHNAADDATENDDESVAQPRPHELYTTALGIYLCWLLLRAISIISYLLPQGRAIIMNKIKQWLSIGVAYATATGIFVLLLGVIPLLFGLLLELVIVVPLRVPIEQTPILFLWQDWALGVLYTKIATALTLMGPDWSLKRAIERAYRDGLRDIDLKFIIADLATPVITCFGLALAVPYVLAHSILPLFFTNQYTRVLIARCIYPFFLLVGLAIAIVVFHIKQFKKLYVAIKNDKYLVGQRLVNYDHRKRRQETPPAPAAPLPPVNEDVVN